MRRRKARKRTPAPRRRRALRAGRARRGAARPAAAGEGHSRAGRATREGSVGPAGSPFHTKRIYEAAADDDGARVLIMRLWPRGIRKDRVDHWLRELGPVKPLLRAFLDGDVEWTEYQRRYLDGLERPEAQEDVARVLELGRARPVTLLCGCADAQRCHRTLLRRYLETRML